MAAEIIFSSNMTVELVRSTGDDAGICEAARVSTLGEMAAQAPGFLARDNGLINFLMRDRHGSPFENGGSMTFFVKAPIFVFREWMRHRIGWSYNEESGRYRKLQPEFYIPKPGRNLVQVGKPGAYEFETGTPEQYGIMRDNLRSIAKDAYYAYEGMLSNGIAREVARMCLPVNIYSSMYATCNPRSLMHFLSLRTSQDNAAYKSFPQREIEMAAEQMETIFAEKFPVTHAAFNTHRRVAP